MIPSASVAIPSLQDPTSLQKLDPKSKEAAEKFEAFLYTFMAKNLRGSDPKGMFSSGPMATFAEMFDEEIGKRVGEGHELGLADQLERSFSPQSVAPPVSHDAHHGTPGVDGTLTSTFGPRVDPINGKQGFHQGVDIAAPEGTPIHAVRGGRVIFAGPHAGHGNLVEIDHGDGVVTRYAHCSHIDVMQGQQVTEDEVIGEVGSTGHSTGPHLHFEVKVDGRPVDPLSWFDSPVPSDP